MTQQGDDGEEDRGHRAVTRQLLCALDGLTTLTQQCVGEDRSRRAVTRQLLCALDGLRDSHAAPLVVLSILQLWPESLTPAAADTSGSSPHGWAHLMWQSVRAATGPGSGSAGGSASMSSTDSHLSTALEVLDAMRPFDEKHFDDLWPTLFAGGFLRLLPRAFPVTLLPLRMCAPMGPACGMPGTALARVVVHSLALRTVGVNGAGGAGVAGVGGRQDTLAKEVEDLAALRGHLYFEALFALGTAVQEANRFQLANVLLFPMMQWAWVDGSSRVRWLVAAAACSPSTFAFCRVAIRVFVEALVSAVATDLGTPEVTEDELRQPGSTVSPRGFAEYRKHMWEAVVWALGTCSRWLDALYLLDPKDAVAFCKGTLQPMLVQAVGWAPCTPPQHISLALVHFVWPGDIGVGALWCLDLSRAFAFCLEGRPRTNVHDTVEPESTS